MGKRACRRMLHHLRAFAKRWRCQACQPLLPRVDTGALEQEVQVMQRNVAFNPQSEFRFETGCAQTSTWTMCQPN